MCSESGSRGKLLHRGHDRQFGLMILSSYIEFTLLNSHVDTTTHVLGPTHSLPALPALNSLSLQSKVGPAQQGAGQHRGADLSRC